MEQVTTKLKRWGNSLGVILPKKVIEKEKLGEGSEIVITVQHRRTMTVGELMELIKKHPLPKPKKAVDEIMQEIDNELCGIQ